MKNKNASEIKKLYDPIKKKYKLPKFDDINREFEIAQIDPKGILVKEIRRCMLHKLQAIAHLFEIPLEPQPSTLHHIF